MRVPELCYDRYFGRSAISTYVAIIAGIPAISKTNKGIYERAVRLGVPDEAPIAVYVKNNAVMHMTQRVVEVEMQSCAKTLYNLTSKEDIGRYTAHSVRVGACVVLHAAGASIVTIQFCL